VIRFKKENTKAVSNPILKKIRCFYSLNQKHNPFIGPSVAGFAPRNRWMQQEPSIRSAKQDFKKD